MGGGDPYSNITLKPTAKNTVGAAGKSKKRGKGGASPSASSNDPLAALGLTHNHATAAKKKAEKDRK